MINDIKQPIEDIKENFKSRLESPYWGFIFFSWLGFNWQNIARLMMSEKPVEERITEITSQDWFFAHYWLAPVIVGIALAVLAPYFQILIALTHSRAVQSKNNERFNLKIQQQRDAADAEIYQVDMQERVDKKKQESKMRLEMIESRKATRLAYQELKKKMFDTDKMRLEREHNQVKSKIQEAERLKKLTENLLGTAQTVQDKFVQRLNEVADVYFSLEGINNKEEFTEFLTALSKTDVLQMQDLKQSVKAMMEKEMVLKTVGLDWPPENSE